MRKTPSRKPVFTIDDLDTLRIITDPLRFQIIEILDREPLSVNQVAEKMGLSASRLYYHIKLLEEHGLIQVVDTRRINNIIEKFYWLTAEDIDFDRELLNFASEGGAENIARMVTSSLDATREDILRSLQARKFNLEKGAPPNPRDMVMIHSKRRLSDATYQAFISRLQALMKEFSELPEETREGEDVSVFSLICYAYPSYYYEEMQEDKSDEREIH